MKNTPKQHPSAYPGEYTPSLRMEELDKAFQKVNVEVSKPLVTITEQPAFYKLQMTAPGYGREDFYLTAHGRVLSISAMNKKSVDEKEHFHAKGEPVECIRRSVILPKDSDTEFVTAEYRNGVLDIFFYKTTSPADNRETQIIVY